MYRIKYQIKTKFGDVFCCERTMNLPSEWGYGESLTLEESAAERLFALEYHRGGKCGEDGDFFIRGDVVGVIKLEALEEV